MSVAVARLIKERYPNCLIIFGGPQVPDSIRLEDFFERYPFIDIAVHGGVKLLFQRYYLRTLMEEILKQCFVFS